MSVEDPTPTTVDALLGAARAQLARLTPAAALERQGDGAVLIDIRSESQRARDGALPGAAVVGRAPTATGTLIDRNRWHPNRAALLQVHALPFPNKGRTSAMSQVISQRGSTEMLTRRTGSRSRSGRRRRGSRTRGRRRAPPHPVRLLPSAK